MRLPSFKAMRGAVEKSTKSVDIPTKNANTEHPKHMIDETDVRLVRLLESNARSSFLAMGKKLRISESTVRKRVGDLETQGVIKKYKAIVEPSKLGYGSVALVGIDVKSEHFLEVAKKLTEFEPIRFVATTTGDHMLMVEIWMQDSSKLRTFIRDSIESMEGVTRTCPAIINERLKEI